ncbi:MAG: hypothetical protein E6G94_05525 [Alphaproteobacteria bacterium]|nr:MAG: hypothetical protein E6G94_05525 [Alphaproteobacteria bacterium]
MIARGFKPVAWVAAVGGAALGCYMVSLQVATERNKLGSVERQIIATKQEIRSLQTELGTRGRLSQLERWNAEVLALSAPASGQYLKDAFTLAQFEQHQPTYEEKAKVTLASADTTAPVAAAPAPAQPQVRMAVAASAPQPAVTATVHQASFTTIAPEPAAPQPAKAKPKPVVKQAQAEAPAAKPLKPTVTETAQAKPRKPSLDSLSASLADAARSETASRKGTR